jgi:hypothetical protein
MHERRKQADSPPFLGRTRDDLRETSSITREKTRMGCERAFRAELEPVSPHIKSNIQQRMKETHKDKMPKDITLPYPTQPIAAYFSCSLNLVSRCCDSRFEPRTDFPNCKRPVYAHKIANAGVEDQVCYIWEPVRGEGVCEVSCIV